MKRVFKVLAFGVPVHTLFLKPVLAYDSLIQATDFVGIKTDVLTTATGIIGVVLVVLGLGLLIKTFTR